MHFALPFHVAPLIRTFTHLLSSFPLLSLSTFFFLSFISSCTTLRISSFFSSSIPFSPIPRRSSAVTLSNFLASHLTTLLTSSLSFASFAPYLLATRLPLPILYTFPVSLFPSLLCFPSPIAPFFFAYSQSIIRQSVAFIFLPELLFPSYPSKDYGGSDE